MSGINHKDTGSFLEDFKYDNVWNMYHKEDFLASYKLFEFWEVKTAWLMDSKYMHLDMNVCAVFMTSSSNLLAAQEVYRLACLLDGGGKKNL